MEVIHEKKLTITDVTQKFIVPTHWLGNLVPAPKSPGSEIAVEMVDELGKAFTFWLTVRSKSPTSQRYHSKPEFKYKEWSAFVEEKDLKEGETIYFWWDEQGGSLRVQSRVKPCLRRLFGTSFIA